MTVSTPTSPLTVTILPHEIGNGAENMSKDEALLDHVAAHPESTVLRTYEWSEPTLSLGYFQKLADAQADPRWQDAPIVRRPTGGGALWHDREWTYAVVLPSRHPLAARPADLYEGVHQAIASWLKRFGLDSERRGEVVPASPRRSKPFLCFLDRDANDLIANGSKIVGSAQRRRDSAVLQHGSILLRRSPSVPELPGVEDFIGGLNRLPLHPRSLIESIAESLGLVSSSPEWPSGVVERSRSLLSEIYRNEAWTARR